MPVPRKKFPKLSRASSWPKKDLSDEEFAQWVETHSLENLIGTAEQVPIRLLPPSTSKSAARPQKTKGRSSLTLHLSQQDLETSHRIAQEKGVPCATLLQSWIRAGLKRERRRSAG